RTMAVAAVSWLAIGAQAVGRRGYDSFLFGVAYYPEQWAESDWEPDARRMRECGVNAVRMGEFGWALMEPSEGQHDFALFDRAIVEALAGHYRDNPDVIGWQIDNEFNNENRECFSESCRVAFRKWLQEKYGTLDALNARWGTRFWSQLYSEWDQIDLPFRTPA